jgi:amylosucrase
MTVGGIPLIYLGDEVGTLNDYAYKDNPEINNDSRWVHRVKADWERYRRRNDPTSPEGRIYQGFQKLIELRKNNAMFSHGELHVIQTENDHVLGFTRPGAIILANFSESAQSLPIYVLNDIMEKEPVKIYGTTSFANGEDLMVDPLDFLVIKHQI